MAEAEVKGITSLAAMAVEVAAGTEAAATAAEVEEAAVADIREGAGAEAATTKMRKLKERSA